MDVAWYIQRLRVMDARELLHRVRERTTLRELEQSQRHLHAAQAHLDHTGFSFCASAGPVLPGLEWDLIENEAVAPEVLAGCWPALGYSWRFFESPHCWHRAPDNGAIWPDRYFARIPYRPGNPFGDARVVWEPSRLQQLVSLALLAQRPTYRERAIALFERMLVSWHRANPPYRGVHYVSAMECALRLIAVCHATDLARAHLNDRRTMWHCVLSIVESHARLIRQRLSLHSSATNHTIAEAAGLIYAGVLFPEFEAAPAWRETGRTVLASHYPRQVLDDGGGAEQAPAYLELITDLAWLGQRLLEPLGLHDSRCTVRIERARTFLDDISAPRDTIPSLGDSDGGHALSPLLRRPRVAARVARPRVAYPRSGYTILRSRAGDARQITFDHGPLGLPPMHAHGHADALSLTLRRTHADLLIDPGTYSYSDLRWRGYFRSGRAHNTVTVDDLDLAQSTAPFIWRRPYLCRLVGYEDGPHSLVLATHDGYRRSGVTHWRGIVYDHADRVIVWDYLTGRDAHRLTLRWHLGVDAQLHDGIVVANDRAFALGITGAATVTRSRGSHDPIVGWRSPAYGVIEPATTIEATYDGALPAEFRTVIDLGCGDDLAPNAAELERVALLRAWVHAD